MAKELKVGMYVRTKEGYICELININDFREPTMKYGVEANYLRDVMFIGDEDIIKASHNIIDLIEVGDYVNGKEVYETGIFGHNGKTFCRIYGNVAPFYNEDVKSIVTKEQFKSLEYEV